MPRTLVIDTATAACSVALIEDRVVIAQSHVVVGRGHAEQVVPMIAALPRGGRADHILVDCGPGSFTGVRVGLAAARGLALGWGITASGYSSLTLLAAAGFGRHLDWQQLAVVLEGGHGEVFVQTFDAALTPLAPFRSLKPDAAAVAVGALPAVGNGVRYLTSLLPDTSLSEALPAAADALLLPADAALLPLTPIYGREPDAKPSA